MARRGVWEVRVKSMVAALLDASWDVVFGGGGMAL